MSKETAVLGNFQINLPGPNGASLSISGYVYDAESAESLNTRMDVCREALARQQAILEIPVLEENIKQLERQLEVTQKAYAELLEKRKVNAKMSSQDQAAFSNYPQQIKFIQNELDKGKHKIESVKKAA
jgi:predicted  nucleic acid-binding Zn-ribbon protein